MPNINDIYYRYQGGLGEDTPVYIHLEKFKVTKLTTKGVWIDFYGQSKFILNEARKRYAYPTKELAWESYLARKKKHKAILESQLRSVEYLLFCIMGGDYQILGDD